MLHLGPTTTQFSKLDPQPPDFKPDWCLWRCHRIAWLYCYAETSI